MLGTAEGRNDVAADVQAPSIALRRLELDHLPRDADLQVPGLVKDPGLCLPRQEREVNALDSPQTELEIIDPQGAVIGSFAGGKVQVAKDVLRVIQQRLID